MKTFPVYKKESLRARVLEFIAKNPNSSERDIIIGLDRVWHRQGHGLVYYDKSINNVLNELLRDGWLNFPDRKYNTSTRRTVKCYSFSEEGVQKFNNIKVMLHPPVEKIVNEKQKNTLEEISDTVEVSVKFLLQAYVAANNDHRKDLLREVGQKTVAFSEDFVKKIHGQVCREWKKKIEDECSKVFQRTLYPIGSLFKHKTTNEVYILASVDYMKINLINLKSGSRCTDPVKVEAFNHENDFSSLNVAQLNQLVRSNTNFFDQFDFVEPQQ
jgi:hypothetical protein